MWEERVCGWSCWLCNELDATPSCDLYETELDLQPVAPETCGIQEYTV